MSETPEESTQLSRLENSLITFTSRIGAAVEDICSYGLTIGESYVPFNPDEDEECTEEEVACSQVWVRVESITPRDSGAEQGWGGDCALTLNMELEVGVLRCIETVEDGEAPTASDVLVYAIQNLEDMNAILCAAMADSPEGEPDIWDAIYVGQWVPTGPLGGQYGGIWSFTVEI